MKNLISTLEHAWMELCKDHAKGRISNISLMAFRFCKEVQKAHPGLIVSFDGRLEKTNFGKPNFHSLQSNSNLRQNDIPNIENIVYLFREFFESYLSVLFWYIF